MSPSPNGMSLEAGDARVVIDPVGSRVTSVRVGDHELLVAPGPDPLLSGCYPMVPWAGRLGRGRFEFDGVGHVLPVDHPPHAIHGLGVHDRWSRSDDTSMALSLRGRWPLAGTAHTRFDLHPDHLTMTVSLDADDHAMPVVLGWHPCFRPTMVEGAAPEVDLVFRARSMWERGRDGLPTGVLTSPHPGPWDDCFAGVPSAPTLRWPHGPTVALEADTDTWVVFDERDDALCVEPQTGPPDAFNVGGAARLEPGRSVSLSLTLRWSTPNR